MTFRAEQRNRLADSCSEGRMTRPRRDPAAEDQEPMDREARASEALELMGRALHLLDANDGPDDAGAYLDQAIHRLRDWIDQQHLK